MSENSKPKLRVLKAAPRGFCAGVVRAIDIVELALEKFGAPVYVRHEIVHNRYVVEDLEAKGAIFVEELDEVPDSDHPVIFSAHGVPKEIPADAERRNLFFLDATCPLVSKVHMEAERHHFRGRHIVLIGHSGHPEVIGTMGQLPEGAIQLIETAEDAETFEPTNPDELAWITQTTLSVDDTAGIVEVLERRFPNIVGPNRQDICYATTNRQEAVKSLAGDCDAILVVGAPNSSNSMRLVEVAQKLGCERSMLVQRASEINWTAFEGIQTLGITAGASAPEVLVEEVIAAFSDRYQIEVETIVTREESVSFKLPRALRQVAAE
ncbi:MAG: 4-hydroxy-3-methylbut-2-enyl diphosphate reductase [Alphaproteobacteria bacterium]|nr:4-hydroxy-3-methylbut-2-enyl diphosphate reductase [Alphaproteobacteria bacterium]